MIYLPFLNAVFFYVINFKEDSWFTKKYTVFYHTYVPRIPHLANLMNCAFCLAFWMGVVQLLIIFGIGFWLGCFHDLISIVKLALIAPYNAITAVVIINLLNYTNDG